MKNFTLLLIYLFLSHLAYSQSFTIDSEQKHTGNVGTEIRAVINIKNLSSKPLHLQIKRLSSQLGSSQVNYFCWDSECLKNQRLSFASSKTIEPGRSSNKLVSVLETGLVETNSSIKFLIYNVNNPSDSLVHEVFYVIEDQNSKKILFHNKDIEVSNIFPNPVANAAFFDYTLISKKKQAKIVIHNVLGTVVAEYDLPSYESRIRITTSDLNSGVYFYTLKVDNDNLITKKLIVKR